MVDELPLGEQVRRSGGVVRWGGQVGWSSGEANEAKRQTSTDPYARNHTDALRAQSQHPTPTSHHYSSAICGLSNAITPEVPQSVFGRLVGAYLGLVIQTFVGVVVGMLGTMDYFCELAVKYEALFDAKQWRRDGEGGEDPAVSEVELGKVEKQYAPVGSGPFTPPPHCGRRPFARASKLVLAVRESPETPPLHAAGERGRAVVLSEQGSSANLWSWFIGGKFEYMHLGPEGDALEVFFDWETGRIYQDRDGKRAVKCSFQHVDAGIDLEFYDFRDDTDGNRFRFNTDDGTISPDKHPDLCWGLRRGHGRHHQNSHVVLIERSAHNRRLQFDIRELGLGRPSSPIHDHDGDLEGLQLVKSPSSDVADFDPFCAQSCGESVRF